jgi:hypothetical protein
MSVGSTTEPHAITRGQNRKMVFYRGNYYSFWLPELGVCTGTPKLQYATTANLGTGWTQQGDTSFTEAGAASGVDFITPLGAKPAAIVGLESAFDPVTSRNYQYLRGYSVNTDGTLQNMDATYPISWIGSTTTGPTPPSIPRVPRGYGSLAQDSDGRFWVAERDEGNGLKADVGSVLNDIILYRTNGSTANPFAFNASPASPLPVCGNPGCTTATCLPCRPFASVVASVTNSERATRVLTFKDPATAKKWVVLVSYVPDPVGAPGKAACYLRAFEQTGAGGAGSWRKIVTVVKPDSLYVSNSLHPDARPSAWMDRKGDVYIGYIPTTGKSVKVAKVSIASEYQTVVSDTLVFTAPVGYSLHSTSIRVDDRKFTTSATRAYLVSLVGADASLGETRVYVHRTQDSGLTWAPSPSEYCLDAGHDYKYQSAALPSAGRSLAALVQTVPPADQFTTCNYSPMTVYSIDLSAERFTP